MASAGRGGTRPPGAGRPDSGHGGPGGTVEVVVGTSDDVVGAAAAMGTEVVSAVESEPLPSAIPTAAPAVPSTTAAATPAAIQTRRRLRPVPPSLSSGPLGAGSSDPRG